MTAEVGVASAEHDDVHPSQRRHGSAAGLQDAVTHHRPCKTALAAAGGKHVLQRDRPAHQGKQAALLCQHPINHLRSPAQSLGKQQDDRRVHLPATRMARQALQGGASPGNGQRASRQDARHFRPRFQTDGDAAAGRLTTALSVQAVCVPERGLMVEPLMAVAPDALQRLLRFQGVVALPLRQVHEEGRLEGKHHGHVRVELLEVADKFEHQAHVHRCSADEPEQALFDLIADNHRPTEGLPAESSFHPDHRWPHASCPLGHPRQGGTRGNDLFPSAHHRPPVAASEDRVANGRRGRTQNQHVCHVSPRPHLVLRCSKAL